MEPRYRRFATVAGVLLVGLAGVLLRLGDFTERLPAFLAAYAAFFAVYAGAIFVFSRLHTPYRRTLTLIFIVAVGCRLVVLGAVPSLSNDVYRYLWEGRVVASGHNPFALSPDAPQLEALQDANYEKINHKQLEAIYPPVAQGVFFLGAVLSPTVTMQKLLFVLFDIGTLVLIALLLRRRGRNLNLCVVYGWSPLVIIEFAHSGHMDAVGIFFLILALYLFERGAAVRGMAALGLSFLAKLLPVMLAPYFLFKKRLLVWAPLAVGVAIAGYLPFAGAGEKLWSSLEVYGQHWQFNSLIYRIIEGIWDNPDAIRLLLAAAVALFAIYQGIREKDLTLFTFRVVACAILLSPTLYPWYVTWIVPLLCLHSSRAWLYFSGVVVASYHVWSGFTDTEVWRLGTGFLVAEYVPFYLMLLLETLRLRRPKSA